MSSRQKLLKTAISQNYYNEISGESVQDCHKVSMSSGEKLFNTAIR